MHRLKLFRRHTSTCTKGHPKDLRITESDSTRATGRAQCKCTIVAQGTLPTGKFLKHQSTGELEWSEAHKVAKLWWEWSDTTPPANVVQELQAEQQKKATTVEVAVAEFLAKKKAEGVSADIVDAHRRLLELRLIPFAKTKGVAYIQQADNAQFWQHFRQSWVNLNPLHNKKPEAGVVVTNEPVKLTTAKRLLSETREFVRFCIGHKWLTDEWTAKKFLKVRTDIEPKEPFTDDDVETIFDATELVTDRQKIGQQNARELLVFCYVLRYSGLRISDVVKLERSNLVKRPGDPENFSLHVFMQKTRKWVYIPIPSGEIKGEPNVAAALLSLPLKQGKFFFKGGTGPLRSNISSWRGRLDHVFKLIEKPLSVHPHPHRFRHTFAARLLERGMDIRDVAEFLGDSVNVVIKHYAKYTAKQQELAAEKWRRVMSGQGRRLEVIPGGKTA
ncbi:MAG TPA: site-specific integrase [Candidatus Limnocylindrales bacterium]|nr:site-specific integrase [Candidatus Limnocylindrales bacterium]